MWNLYKTYEFFDTVSKYREGGKLRNDTKHWIFHPMFWVIFSSAKGNALHMEEMLVWYALDINQHPKKKKKRCYKENHKGIPAMPASFCLLTFRLDWFPIRVMLWRLVNIIRERNHWLISLPPDAGGSGSQEVKAETLPGGTHSTLSVICFKRQPPYLFGTASLKITIEPNCFIGEM